MSGTLYGIGLGPGDPELLTLKAHRILQGVPVVAYPAPDGAPSLARAIAAPHLPGGQIEVPIGLCMAVERAPGQGGYDAAAPGIARHLEAGRDVAVLCEGDPFFYGSFLHLFARLGERFRTVVVPGVSSVMAAAAAASRPLAVRGDRFAVLPATLPNQALRCAIESIESAAILKLGRHFARVKALLTEMNLSEDAIYAERVTQAGERVMPLRETGEEAPYFSMILLYKGAEPSILGAGARR